MNLVSLRLPVFVLLASATILLSYNAWIRRDDCLQQETVRLLDNGIQEYYLSELNYPHKFQRDDPTYCRDIKIWYPEITHPTEHEQSFNKLVKEYIHYELEKFEMGLDCIEDIPNELFINYTIFFFNKSLISVRFNRFFWHPGMAHPCNAISSITYDLSNGRFLELKDIYKKESDYHSYLVKKSKQDLKKILRQDHPHIIDEAEAFELIDKPVDKGVDIRFSQWPHSLYGDPPGCWNVTLSGLFITFNTYEVSCGAAGSFEILIPYANYLDDEVTKYMQQPTIINRH